MSSVPPDPSPDGAPGWLPAILTPRRPCRSEGHQGLGLEPGALPAPALPASPAAQTTSRPALPVPSTCRPRSPKDFLQPATCVRLLSTQRHWCPRSPHEDVSLPGSALQTRRHTGGRPRAPGPAMASAPTVPGNPWTWPARGTCDRWADNSACRETGSQGSVGCTWGPRPLQVRPADSCRGRASGRPSQQGALRAAAARAPEPRGVPVPPTLRRGGPPPPPRSCTHRSKNAARLTALPGLWTTVHGDCSRSGRDAAGS